MDNQKHSIATIKSIYNDRWNVEELFKFVKSNLSLNSIEESQEENVLKSIYSNVIISLISYLFTTLNEKTETESKARIIRTKSHFTKKTFFVRFCQSRIIRSQNAKNVFSGLISNPIF